jgi:hypothetical protein
MPCPACGRDVRWEYRDVTVPVGELEHGRAGFAAAVDAAVLRVLQEAGAAGWAADGPTDWNGLYEAGRYTWRRRGVLPEREVLTSVRLRLRRATPR